MEMIEQMALALEATGDFKVLKRLRPRVSRVDAPNTPLKRGLIIDLETTGLDPKVDEVIELALQPFAYNSEGEIIELLPALNKLREPSRVISAKVTALTGITNEMVAECRIETNEILEVVEPVEICVAHNAKFDRPFAERLHPAFANKPWGCSMTEIPWTDHGADGLKLSYLLASMVRLFHDGHRAHDDCQAVLALLAHPLGTTGRTALAHLLVAAAKTSTRIWATGAPFDRKEELRSRAYKWNVGNDGRPRAWYLDVDESDVEAELAALRTTVFDPTWMPVTAKLTALERFSERV